MKRDYLKNCKKIVVKVGSSSLTLRSGKLDARFIDMLAKDISTALSADEERRVVLVTSGSVAAGMAIFNLDEKPSNINRIQALSSLGQNSLMQYYSRSFGDYMYKVSQLLLTKDVVFDKTSYANARRTLNELLTSFNNVIPIINENDAVSTYEIKFGENDTLAAHVATLIEADLLIIISDVDGIYTADPKNEGAEKIGVISEVNIDTLKYVSPSKSKLGTGGMKTKLVAAQIANKAAIPMILASYTTLEDDSKYSRPYLLNDILGGGDIGTLFEPDTADPFNRRKHWLAFAGKECGGVKINKGAEDALINRKTSLLPSGITEVYGDFDKDEIVYIINENGEKIAKGMVEYSSEDTSKIMGRQSGEIAGILNVSSYSDEVINRSNMVTMNYL